MPHSRSGSVAIVGNPASAMRCGNSAMTPRRSALSMRCRCAISGSVGPQPKQRLVLGSIMQTAIHGVSWLIRNSGGYFGVGASQAKVPSLMIGLRRGRLSLRGDATIADGRGNRRLSHNFGLIGGFTHHSSSNTGPARNLRAILHCLSVATNP